MASNMTPKKAKARMPPHKPPSDFMTILGEMDGTSDRAAAIVSAAFVENNLALALISRFHQLKLVEQEHLFKNLGSLSDFAGKIDLGYALNIYGPLVRDDLNNVRRIRNAFAHELEVRNFDHPDVAGLCDTLHAPSQLDTAAHPKLPKQRTHREMYSDTVDHLATRFRLESNAPVGPSRGAHCITGDY